MKTALERRRETNSRFYKKNPVKRMLWHAKARAEDMDLPFNIDFGQEG